MRFRPGGVHFQIVQRNPAETTQNKTKQTCFRPKQTKQKQNNIRFTPGGGLEIRGTIECRNKNKLKQNNVRSSPGGGVVQTLTHGAVFKTKKNAH